MEISLEGKCALVTGGARGLGLAITQALAGSGARVMIASRSSADLRLAAEHLNAQGLQIDWLPLDLNDPNQIAAAVDQAVARLGGLDILVNNAATTLYKPSCDVTVAEWDEIFNVNARGLFLTACAAARHMRAAADKRGGSVINIASTAGVKGVPRMAVYAASKAAVISLTKSLALEWLRDNIRLNVIAPTYFETDMTAAARSNPRGLESMVRHIPLGRLGRPEEIGPLVVYLASDQAAFMTGEVLYLSGGSMTL
ncbi:MAG: glucose 1-dehydrogenase [Chloroflexi bacterium]|nr:glucose 1-dehydrogenase [Chloroflexota bacterium]